MCCKSGGFKHHAGEQICNVLMNQVQMENVHTPGLHKVIKIELNVLGKAAQARLGEMQLPGTWVSDAGVVHTAAAYRSQLFQQTWGLRLRKLPGKLACVSWLLT